LLSAELLSALSPLQPQRTTAAYAIKANIFFIHDPSFHPWFILLYHTIFAISTKNSIPKAKARNVYTFRAFC